MSENSNVEKRITIADVYDALDKNNPTLVCDLFSKL